LRALAQTSAWNDLTGNTSQTLRLTYLSLRLRSHAVAVDVGFLAGCASLGDDCFTIFIGINVWLVVLGFVALLAETGTQTGNEGSVSTNAGTCGCITWCGGSGSTLLAASLTWKVVVEVDFARYTSIN